MMVKKINVRTIGAIVDRHPIGSEIVLNESTANNLSEQGIVEIIGEVKPKPVKKASKSTSKKTTKDTGKKTSKKSTEKPATKDK